MAKQTLPDIYSFTDYKKYLRKWIESHPMKGRGQLSALAKVMNCQTSYLSKVVSGDLNLSVEQALDACSFLSLNESEADYFLNLVSLERAGTVALRQRLKKQVTQMQGEGKRAWAKSDVDQILSSEDQQTYYSSWHYAVVHIAATISQYTTPEKISQAVNLPEDVVAKTLQFLLEKDLVRRLADGSLTFGKRRLHLDSNSLMQTRHHINFRMLSIQNLEKGMKDNNLHYSSVASVAKADVDVIREQISQMIRATREKIRDSEPADELVGLVVDFFKIAK
ncbi:TIGR02147 family protein [Bdellovibrio sp. HCB209]|uniref:TIGR02147 family protein n=1 Tax=Bdellovibrio sp. HCB209 TaxID=3394354 RepID=UPI0039B3A659